MFNTEKIGDLAYSRTIDKIIELNKHIKDFWSNADGWAPLEAANLLSRSRLDWLTSLSNSLYKWENEPISESMEGDLILAWANLGTLVEGSMKFFLSVFYEDYKKDINRITKRKREIDPDSAMFNELRLFFYNSVWEDNEKEIKNNWLNEIQQYRNAIHAYKDRDIKDFSYFRIQVNNYLFFLIDLLSRVPYSDCQYRPDFF